MGDYGDNIKNQIDDGVNVPVRNRNFTKSLTGTVNHDGKSLDFIPKMVKKIIKEDMWRIQTKGDGIIEFETFEEFVTTDMPEGMGTTIQRLQDLCHNDIETLVLIDEVVQRPKGKRRKNKLNINNRVMSGVTSRSQIFRRLRKDRPDLYEDVKLGIKKPTTAMREAGFGTPQVMINIKSSKSAAKTLLKAVKTGKTSKEFIADLVSVLKSSIDNKDEE